MSDDQIQILFAGGPNQTLDPRHLPPGSVVDLLNVNYDSDGSYQVRTGYVQMGPSVGTSLRQLHAYYNELLANDGKSLYSFNDQGSGSWVLKDAVPQLSVTHAPVQASTSSYLSWAEAVGSGYRIVAWVDGTDSFTRASVYSLATGALVYGPFVFTASGSFSLAVSVGVIGTTAVLVIVSSNTTITAYTLTLSALGTWSGSTTLSDANFTSAVGVFAVAYLSATFVVCYQDGANGAAQKVRMRSFNSALALQQNVQGASTGLTGPFKTIAAQGTTGENLWISVSVGATTTGVLMNANPSTLAAVAGPLSIGVATNLAIIGGSSIDFTQCQQMAIARVSSTQCLVIADIAANATNFIGVCVTWAQFTTAGVVGVPSGAVWCGLASQPIFMAELSSVGVMLRSAAFAAGQQPFSTYYFVDLQSGTTATLTTPRVLAVLSPLIANNHNVPTSIVLPIIVSPSSGSYEVPLAVTRGAIGRLGLELYRIAAQAPSQYQSAHLGRELYVNGGFYDGKLLVENGLRAPAMGLTVNASGSVQFGYATTWARIDANGNLEESAPAPTKFVTSTSTPNVQVQQICEHLTNKMRLPLQTQFATSPIFMLVYRTPNLAAGDSTLYRVTNEPFPLLNQDVSTSASITYTDTLSDASLTDGTHPAIYTTSGELPHNQPETLGHVVAHKNRIWGIAADNKSVWFSQTYSDGQMPAWHPNNILTIDDTSEVPIALASLYDKLLIFTVRRIYVVFGDGPSVSGVGSDLTQPQRVASGSGCTDPRSVVNSPSGIFFLSTRGIEKIGSDLTVEFVGLPVSLSTQTYPVCTSAVLCPNTSTIRFTMVTSETFPTTSTGVLLVYDLRRERWTIHSLTNGGTRAGTALAPVEDAVFHPLYGYVEGHPDSASGGIVTREAVVATDPIPWNDFGQYSVPLKVTMAWIKAMDLQGWAHVRRIRVLAQYYDQHDLTLALNYNYGAQAETHTWLQATIANLVVSGVEQLRTTPGQGKSESIQCVLTMTPKPAVGTGRGAALNGVAFEVHKKKGGYRNLSLGAKA
jgi:hypothetical protein